MFPSFTLHVVVAGEPFHVALKVTVGVERADGDREGLQGGRLNVEVLPRVGTDERAVSLCREHPGIDAVATVASLAPVEPAAWR